MDVYYIAFKYSIFKYNEHILYSNVLYYNSECILYHMQIYCITFKYKCILSCIQI